MFTCVTNIFCVNKHQSQTLWCYSELVVSGSRNENLPEKNHRVRKHWKLLLRVLKVRLFSSKVSVGRWRRPGFRSPHCKDYHGIFELWNFPSPNTSSSDMFTQNMETSDWRRGQCETNKQSLFFQQLSMQSLQNLQGVGTKTTRRGFSSWILQSSRDILSLLIEKVFKFCKEIIFKKMRPHLTLVLTGT